MRHEIVLAPDAVVQLRALAAHIRARVRDALETHLRHGPARTSKSRIKRLRELSQPQYRLGVDDIRVFYDVSGTTVQILAIIPKAQAQAWLDAEGVRHAAGPTREGEG